MKAFAFITGAISLALIPLGYLFKVMYWPGARIIFAVGVVIFSLLFIPTIFKYLYDKEK